MKTALHEDGGLTVRLSLDEVESILAEYVARHAQLSGPIARRSKWQQGAAGPELELTVRSAPNVARFDPLRTRPTVRTGRRQV